MLMLCAAENLGLTYGPPFISMVPHPWIQPTADHVVL